MQEITFAIEAALITGGSLALLTLASRVPAAADQDRDPAGGGRVELGQAGLDAR